MLKKVLILSASAGAGHLRAAQAVEKAFQESNKNLEVRNIDTLEYTNTIFLKLYSKAYLEFVNKMPGLFGYFYERTDKPWHNERGRTIFDKFNAKRFIKMIEEYQPDIAVCTHFLPAELISWLKAKNKINTKLAVVVTDFDVHAFWLCRNYDQYFVAMDESKIHLEHLGIDADKITVSGIPIDPVFSIQKDKKKMRQMLNLDPNLPAILVSAGGFGVGPVEKLTQSLTKMQSKAQIIVVCGKNKELKNKIDKYIKNLESDIPVRFHTIGFTDQMDSYMAASDLILGKTGGLTTSEALAKGLGFIIVDPIPGQEERNADHLMEEGIAVKCNNWPVLAYKIDKLLGNPKRIAQMQTNARNFAKPYAARDIVQNLMDSF
jgi:processive 1,2-diacylglycerol beta-glucosyltransferase